MNSNTSGKKIAFIDESGNFGTDPNLSGNSSHFIITAVIIDEGLYESIYQEADEIRKKNFKEGEMKSSHVGKNHPKRFSIIHSLLKLDFKIVSFVVDKRLLKFNNTGLRFKKVYYKFLNNMLHNELKILYPNLKIVSAEYGTEDFMMEFSQYVRNQGQISFFDDFEFSFQSSKNEPLIQVADMIGGTISLGYEVSKKCAEFSSFIKLLDEKIVIIRHWPINSNNYQVNLELLAEGDYDKEIAMLSIRSAVNYIDRHRKKSDQVTLDRIYILEYLLNQVYCGNAKKYFYSGELIKHISSSGSEPYNTHSFISQIISPLRDENVIIASGNNGYKIPVTEAEIYSYANKTVRQVLPMLNRLEKARNRILAATNNSLDILAKEEYSEIKRYFDI